MLTWRTFSLALIVTLLASPLVGPSVANDDSPKDKKKQREHELRDQLQGRWKITEGVNQGRPLPQSELAESLVTIDDNVIITYDHGQEERFRAIFSIDDEQKPIEITMTSIPKGSSTSKLDAEAKPDEVRSLGILKVKNKKQFTLCYGLPGADRPKEFKSLAGSKHMLFQLERIGELTPLKPSAKDKAEDSTTASSNSDS